MTVADTLAAAADLISHQGLARGIFTDATGGMCAMQALWSATGATGSVDSCNIAVGLGLATLAQHNGYRNAAITLQRGIAPLSIARWSDTHDHDEVVAVLRDLAGDQRAELVRLGRP
jgi:hypothetical protein